MVKKYVAAHIYTEKKKPLNFVLLNILMLNNKRFRYKKEAPYSKYMYINVYVRLPRAATTNILPYCRTNDSSSSRYYTIKKKVFRNISFPSPL